MGRTEGNTVADSKERESKKKGNAQSLPKSVRWGKDASLVT